jgi:hypothetical protein
LGQSFLVSRLFCQHRWSEWRYDSTLCSVPRGARQKRRVQKSKLYVVWLILLHFKDPVWRLCLHRFAKSTSFGGGGLIQNSKGKFMTSKMLWLCFLKCTITLGGMFLLAISCQAEKLHVRKDAHRKPLLPHLTGSWCYGLGFWVIVTLSK